MNNADISLKEHLTAIGVAEPVSDALMQCFTPKRYEKNQHFSFAGQISDRLGFVVDGLFAMYVEGEDGSIFTKDFLQPRDFLLGGFTPGGEAQVFIQAIRESVVMEAKYSEVRAVLNQHEDVRVLSEEGMQRRYQAICDRLEGLAVLDATERYLNFKTQYGSVEADIPQYLIASYLGVTPTQLSRIRRKLMSAKIY